MSFRTSQKLREDMWDYEYKSALDEGDNVLSFSQAAGKAYSATALNLVRQAAEIFSKMEEQAHEKEVRARSVCKSLAEKLRLAEEQRDLSERARREAVGEINHKLQELSRALQLAQSRVIDAEEHAAAAEFRAQAAETRLYAANKELAAVEKVIRTRLL